MNKQRFGGLGMGQIKGYADGGKVTLRKKPKLKPHVPAKVADPIRSESPGGPHTPGEREKRGERGGPIVRKKKGG